MKFIQFVAALALAAVLIACGGGGGSPGENGTGTATTGASTTGAGTGTIGTGTTTVTVSPTVTEPTMVFELIDASGVPISGTPNLSQTEERRLRVTLKTAKGSLKGNERVTITLDNTNAVLVPSQGVDLTNSNGVAVFVIKPASVDSDGVVVASAAAAVDGTSLGQKINLKITPGTVVLSNLVISPNSVQKGQAVSVKVDVAINGQPAQSNAVAVNFSSTCGVASPASSKTNSSGKAEVVVQTNNSGNCRVTVNAGVSSLDAGFTVTQAPIVGLQFVGAVPALIYQTGSAGPNKSEVKFRVTNAISEGVQGEAVQATLTNTDGGISFCGAPSTAQSGPDGVVTFTVCGGTLPATVQVKAELLSNADINTRSNLLTVQTGMPTQRFLSMAVSRLNIYAGGLFTEKYDGVTTDITVFAADRQGNPVPNGTPITFVAEGGQINSSNQSSCVLSGGQCTVRLIAQNYRPLGSSVVGAEKRPGRVTVLAFADGEESFTDLNNNNRYDPGEPFEDLGVPFLDKDEDGVFTRSYRNLVVGSSEGEATYPIPASAVGTQSCITTTTAVVNGGLSVADTCDGKWSASTKVRAAVTIVFSGGYIAHPSVYTETIANMTIPEQYRTAVLSQSAGRVVVRLADADGNPLPVGTAIAVKVLGNTVCTAETLQTEVLNTTEPTPHGATLDKCGGGGVLSFVATAATPVGALKSTFDVRLANYQVAIESITHNTVNQFATVRGRVEPGYTVQITFASGEVVTKTANSAGQFLATSTAVQPATGSVSVETVDPPIGYPVTSISSGY